MFRAYLLSIFVATCFGMQLRNITDCGSNAVIHSFSLEPCDSEPCNVHGGHTYIGITNFTSTIDSVNATNKASVSISGVSMPIPMTPIDACANDIKCPVQKGYTQVFTTSVKCIEFVSIQVAVKWEVKGDNDKDIICIVVPLNVIEY